MAPTWISRFQGFPYYGITGLFVLVQGPYTEMHNYHIAALSVLLGCLSASAAPVDNCGFEKVPRDALVALQEARGKPFIAGAVFVNGKYLPPPYVVSRYGTAIVINGCQVTGQVIPWSRFLGARPAAAAPEAASDAAPAADKSAPQEKFEEAKSLDDLFSDGPADSGGSSPAAPAAAPVAAAADSEDLDSTIDDLFGDETDKPKPKPRPAVAKARAPRPAVPAGPPPKYVPSARTRQLQETIDMQRTQTDRSLRSGHFYFFSPRYASVGGNLRILGSLMEKLPDAMKDAASAEDLYARMRRAGLGFVSMELCTDLYANKRTFPSLYELRTRVREDIKRQKEMTADD